MQPSSTFHKSASPVQLSRFLPLKRGIKPSAARRVQANEITSRASANDKRRMAGLLTVGQLKNSRERHSICPTHDLPAAKPTIFRRSPTREVMYYQPMARLLQRNLRRNG